MAMQHQHNGDQRNDLIINIHPQLRRRLTIAAAQSNLSLEEYVGRILEQVAPPETGAAKKRRGLDWAAVAELKRYREEIRRAHPGQVIEDSVELLRQAREERTRELEQE